MATIVAKKFFLALIIAMALLTSLSGGLLKMDRTGVQSPHNATNWHITHRCPPPPYECW